MTMMMLLNLLMNNKLKDFPYFLYYILNIQLFLVVVVCIIVRVDYIQFSVFTGYLLELKCCYIILLLFYCIQHKCLHINIKYFTFYIPHPYFYYKAVYMYTYKYYCCSYLLFYCFVNKGLICLRTLQRQAMNFMHFVDEVLDLSSTLAIYVYLFRIQ